MPRPNERRPAALLREHYEVERQLADRLRNATREQRRTLYGPVYDELYQRVPHHPQLTRKSSPELTQAGLVPQLRLLRPYLKPDSVVLEIGPGDCALSIALAKRVRQVYALDVSEKITEQLSAPANFKLILSDGTSVPLPAGSVDVAYSNQLMEHLHPDDAREQLEGIWRALRPGGVYICITPNRVSGPHDISSHFDSIATGFHLPLPGRTRFARGGGRGASGQARDRPQAASGPDGRARIPGNSPDRNQVGRTPSGAMSHAASSRTE
jgi:SAM-dependent methyltransferase